MFVRSRVVCRRVARYGGCLKKLRKTHHPLHAEQNDKIYIQKSQKLTTADLTTLTTERTISGGVGSHLRCRQNVRHDG